MVKICLKKGHKQLESSFLPLESGFEKRALEMTLQNDEPKILVGLFSFPLSLAALVSHRVNKLEMIP